MTHNLDAQGTLLKRLKKHYYYLLLALFLIGLVGISALDPQHPLIGKSETLEYIKSVMMIFTLFSIPGIFGWFTSRTKNLGTEKDEMIKLKTYRQAWVIRAWVIFVLALINLAIVLLSFDQSMMYILAIVVFIFFYCRPSIGPKNVITEKTEEL